MTAFAIKDGLFQDYARQEIINDFVQKPVILPDLFEKVRKQLRDRYHKLEKRL